MTTYLGKSCSFCLPRVPFVNCRQFMYLVISLLVLRAGYGIWLYQFLIIAYLLTFLPDLFFSETVLFRLHRKGRHIGHLREDVSCHKNNFRRADSYLRKSTPIRASTKEIWYFVYKHYINNYIQHVHEEVSCQKCVVLQNYHWTRR